MKFLILTQYFKPEIGAAPTRLNAMCKQLINLGHEVEVVTAMPNYPQGRIFDKYKGKLYTKDISEEGYSIHRFWVMASQGKGIKRLFAYLSLAFVTTFGIFKANKPDWIFVNSGPMFLSFPAYIASLFWRVPTIFNVADLWPDSIFKIKKINNKFLKKALYFFENWTYKKANKVTAITDGVKEVLINEKHVPEDKICFLPNGVSTELFKPQKKCQEIIEKHQLQNKFVFCYPGTHGYLHALHRVLDACILLQNRDDIRLLLIGGGSEKSWLEEKVKRDQIKNAILVDPQPEEDLVNYLSVMDCGLIHQRNTPLANETRPAKMFPIMAMGKPLLFSGFGEGAQMIHSLDAGVVIGPENPVLLAQTMKDFADKKYDTQKLGENGLNYINKNLDWKLIVENWLEGLH